MFDKRDPMFRHRRSWFVILASLVIILIN